MVGTGGWLNAEDAEAQRTAESREGLDDDALGADFTIRLTFDGSKTDQGGSSFSAVLCASASSAFHSRGT